MRGKRAKQYRKLMQQYSLSFGFREPYQVLVDSQMIEDAERFKMDLTSSLERTLSAKVKPLITQCSIRHLYNLPQESIPKPLKETLIHTAKSMERRRCNHHTLDNPLSDLECLSSIIDPKNSKINKHRYVVASQDERLRRYCRAVKGVPLIYVKRSVMVMEPMADSSLGVREGLEKEKFRSGLKGRGSSGLGKRKRDSDGDGDGDNENDNDEEMHRGDAHAEIAEGDGVDEAQDGGEVAQKKEKKKKIRGLKGPNPLSMKKSKRPDTKTKDVKPRTRTEAVGSSDLQVLAHNNGNGQNTAKDLGGRKRKRRRHKVVDEGNSSEAGEEL